MNPTRFIVCTPEDLKTIFNDGWVDLLDGAKLNNLTVIDRKLPKDYLFWKILCKKRSEFKGKSND